jgi:hypothetical protein
MRDELPEECKRELDYRALVETLRLLEGEVIHLSIMGLESRGGGTSSRLGVAGTLRNIGYSWAASFAIGDSGRLLLYEPDFIAASLLTFDGNDFFRITARFADVTLVIGDESCAGQEFSM